MHSLRWIPDIAPWKLAISARPAGGDALHDELRNWANEGVASVVSLLEPREARDLGLHQERVACQELGMRYLSYPIPDRGVPSSKREFNRFLGEVLALLVQGQALVVHCRAGIGRSGLVAGCLLGRKGVASGRVFDILSKARGVSVPDTDEQSAWVQEFSAWARSAA